MSGLNDILDTPRIRADLKIDEERRRQDEKWGIQDHPFDRWLAILTEETGECSQAWLTGHYGGWTPERRAHYVEELVQVAAVAQAMLENELRRGDSYYLDTPKQEIDH